MNTNRWFRTVCAITVIIVIVTLTCMVIDSAISLAYSRSQVELLSQKCELLARLASKSLQGKTIEEAINSVGSEVLIKHENGELSLDSVYLRVEAGKIVSVDAAGTCGISDLSVIR